MLCGMIYIEALGFLAGLTNLMSSVPQLRANMKKPDCAANQSAARNACQATANVLWLVYGLAAGSVAMSTFSTLGLIMAALLFLQVRKAQKGATKQRELAENRQAITALAH